MMYLIPLVIVFISLMMIATSEDAHALTQNGSFEVFGSGFTVSEETVHESKIDLVLEVKDFKKGELTFERGTIEIDGIKHSISKYSARSLREGKFFIISGSTQDDVGFRLFGKKVEQVKNDYVYEIKGTYLQDDTKLKTLYAVQVKSKTSQPLQIEEEAEIPVKEEVKEPQIKIKLLASHTDRPRVQYSYKFETKVYDSTKNPTGNVNQNWGHLEGVKINVLITDDRGKEIRKFEGMTDKFGYFSDNFIIPWGVIEGKYYANFTADYKGIKDTKRMEFFISYPSDDGKSSIPPPP